MRRSRQVMRGVVCGRIRPTRSELRSTTTAEVSTRVSFSFIHPLPFSTRALLGVAWMLIWAIDSALGQHGHLRLVLRQAKHSVRYHRLCAGSRKLGDAQLVLAREHLQPVRDLPEPSRDLRHDSVRRLGGLRVDRDGCSGSGTELRTANRGPHLRTIRAAERRGAFRGL